MNKILIVNVNWLGDVLFSTPFIRALKKNYPKSFISCMIVPRCLEALEGNPYIDEFIIYDEDGAHRNIFRKLELISKLKEKGFDAAFILRKSFTRSLMLFLAKIPRRIGYRYKKTALLLTDNILLPKGIMHKAELFLNIAKELGLCNSEYKYDFSIDEADRVFIRDFLEANLINFEDFLIAINPGANWLPKRWPKERFAHLADSLINDFGSKVIITGAEKDTGLAQDILKNMKSPAVNAAGKTTLKQLGALFERCNLVVANDTGPMHIALACGSNVICLFGPTNPNLTGPWGEGRYKVIQKSAGSPMDAISVEEVLNEVRKTTRK